MKFNIQLKEELKRFENHLKNAANKKEIIQKEKINETILAPERSTTAIGIRKSDKQSTTETIREKTSEKVVGGDILWKPIDRAAAMLLAKSPWWAKPPQISTTPEPKKNNKRKLNRKIKHMVRPASEISGGIPSSDTHKKWVVFGDYAIEVKGICKRTGEPLLDSIDMWPILLEQMNKMKHELTPASLAMIDGEKALRDATKTAKECMEEMRSASKVFLDEIRQTKYATLAETSALISPLKEIRQFFIGDDYKEQMEHLSDFAGLCERLQKLKNSGFLDSVADTMLRLSEK